MCSQGEEAGICNGAADGTGVVVSLADEMLALREMLAQKGTVISYSGFITEEILTSIAKALRKKLELDGQDKFKSRRIFSVFVELFQNVIRYSAESQIKQDVEDPVDLRYGLLSIGEQDNVHFVCCCNLVNREDVSRLNETLARIKSMKREELKELYKETLRGETPQYSKGAGVGFIEIARQAPFGFDFGFVDVDNDYAFFCLKAYA